MKLIDEKLNISENIANTLVQIDTPKSVVIIDSEKEDPSIEEDFNHARANILDVTDTAKIAIEYAVEVMKTDQSPRSFEALNALIKTVADLSKDSLEIHQKKKSLRKSSVEKETHSTTNIQNAVFTGNPLELQKFIKSMKQEG